jgi:hypothetical protein
MSEAQDTRAQEATFRRPRGHHKQQKGGEAKLLPWGPKEQDKDECLEVSRAGTEAGALLKEALGKN